MKIQHFSLNFPRLFVLWLCLTFSGSALATNQNSTLNKGNWQLSVSVGAFDWKQGDDLDIAGLSFAYRLPEFEYGSIALEIGVIRSTGGGEITQTVLGNPADIETSIESLSGSAVYRSKGTIFVMGKMGYAERQFHFDFADPSKKSAQDTTSDFISGAGIGLRLGSNAELELAYTSYESEQNLISMGLNWKFSSQKQNVFTKKPKKKKPAKKTKTKTVKKTVEQAPSGTEDPMVIRRHSPTQIPESDPGRNLYKNDQTLPNGRSVYPAEKAARIDGCRRPTLQTKRNKWPYELYRAACQDGSSRLVSCEWGQCEVIK